MKFRLKAMWEFRSQQGRSVWLSEYNIWRVGRAFALEENQIIDMEDEVPKIQLHQDVACVNQAETIGLFDLIKNRSQGGVFHVFESLHQCERVDGIPGGARAWQFFEFGVRP